MTDPYLARRPSRSLSLALRGQQTHVLAWGDAAPPAAGAAARPLLVLVHGWMDVAASYQFLVDALDALDGDGAPPRRIVAPDWRGFGLSEAAAGGRYWFPDYLADLDALLDALAPDGAAVDLVGHSMGGNVAMSYAGVRPARVRRLVNLEGFGLPRTRPEQAPERLVKWLDELKVEPRLRSYDSVDAVAERLLSNNPLLTPDKAAWLAPRWSRRGTDGRWHILGDPAHKRVNPVLYQVDEVLATWRRIACPLLWVEGDRTDVAKWWGHRYPRAEFDERLAVVAQARRVALSPCGHMLHHDQPDALARHLAGFLD